MRASGQAPSQGVSMNTPTQRSRLAILEWVFSALALVGGIAFASVYLFGMRHGTTPEAELTLVVGPACDVGMTEDRSTRYLKFSVGAYQTEYASDQPRFDDVLSAVQSGAPLRMWVSTKQETVFARQGWVPLYKVFVAERAILSYHETVAHKRTQ